MRITQLSLAGRGAWPDLQLEAIKPQLNVFYGQPRTGKSTIAQLVSHLLYGKEASSWRQQFGQTVPRTEGSLSVASGDNSYVLRRHYDSGNDTTGRLTVAATDGANVDSKTVRSLLAGLSPELAMQLLAVDFAEPPRIEWLLSETFAREFTNQLPGEITSTTSASQSCCNAPTDASWVDQIDRRRVDELIRQRDAIAAELEQQVGVGRHESGVLERELQDLETTVRNKRERSQQLQAQLRGVDAELAETESRLRYFRLDAHSQHSGSSLSNEQQRQQVAELDAAIADCRATLGNLQMREKAIRTELAQIGADGTADSVTCLADGRVTLGVLEQLLDDLDTEVAQLARANEPGRCVGHDSHARLVPVTNMLRQQVYTLCGHLTEQERIARRTQITTEIRQLGRVQSDMSERLELLLSRRESLVQQSQQAGRTMPLVPQLPVADHCRCDHHGRFMEGSDSMILSHANRNQIETEAQGQLSTLERTRTALVDEMTALKLDIDRLEGRWKELQGERAHLLGGTAIEKQQAELDRLEKMIEGLLHGAQPRTTTPPAGTWRASDVLAQLTDGHLVQIRLERQNRRAMVVDRNGRMLAVDSLTTTQHDQLYLALTLALVSSYARRGIHLPLILDEPFLRQDAAGSATLAGVLNEFARAGHQVLIFTEDHGAQRQFAGLGSCLFDLEALRHGKTTAPPTATFAAALAPRQKANPVVKTSTRVVRETLDGSATPALRIATVNGNQESEDLFYLNESSAWEEFPVLGSETAALFALIEIRSVGDLLNAEPAEIARLLSQPDIQEETVALWQSHMGLMCHVPGLALNDAQLLTAVGIYTLDDLADADLDKLWQSIESFFSSARGRRFSSSGHRYSRSQLGRWRDGARRNRSRWQQSRSRRSSWRSNRRGRSSQSSRSQRSRRNGQTDRNTNRTQRQTKREWKFTLGRENEVEAAPSIGPKTADRLAKVGIRSVADLLSANPDSIAAELSVSHIKAKTVAAWQHQARLVCQIPELPGYGAQLLVANGFTEPEQLADTSVDELVGKILAFCQTKEGQRIMRSGDAPERDKIAEWIECAAHRRPLEAA